MDIRPTLVFSQAAGIDSYTDQLFELQNFMKLQRMTIFHISTSVFLSVF